MPREPSPFEFTDDDESPLPTPPEFDNRRENVPDLLEGDLSDDDTATAEELETEEPELLEGSVIMEVPRTHRLPPPIPMPLPTGPARPVFVDDGEIALPPRISQKPQSFPFRQLRREPSGLFESPEPPEPSPTSASWRSAALRHDPGEEVEAEEVEADEIVDEAPPPARRPAPPAPARQPAAPPTPAPPPAAPVFSYSDDDDDSAPSSPPAPEPTRYRDPHSMFADAESAETMADAPAAAHDDASSVLAAPQDNPATGMFGVPSDDEAPPAESDTTSLYRVGDVTDDWMSPRPPQPSAAIPVAAIDDDDDDAAWTVPTTPAETPPVTDDDEWSPPAAAPSGQIAADDPIWSSPARALTDDDATPPPSDEWPAPPASAEPATPTDDDTPPVSAPISDDDDWSQVAATPAPPEPEPAPVSDDDDWSQVAAAPAPAEPEPAPVTDDDDWSQVSATPPAPPEPAPISDDDDWSQVAATPAPPEPAPVSDDDDWSTVSAPPAPAAAEPAPISDDEPTTPAASSVADDEPPRAPVFDDDEWTPALPASTPVSDDDEWTPAPPASAPPAETSPVSDDDEWTPAPPASTVSDDDEWTPAPPASLRPADADTPSTQPPAFSGAIRVADQIDDDDEWVPNPPATVQQPPAASDSTLSARPDDDDEWQPQQATKVTLIPVPTDLAEAFPLDLWSDPDELIGRDLGRYHLVKPLSRGMVTRVYAARSPDDRPIAIRVLAPTYSPAEPRARQFLFEALQLTKLRGENLVEVLDSGNTHDHLSYYVMELLDGDTLAAVLRAEGPLPWAEVAAIASQICDALIVAHDRDIVHSDLSLATCLRLRPPADEPPPADGERRRSKIKLLGVGITPLLSCYRNPEGNLAVSQGTPPGTAEYMAPEIASGGHPDVHTEIYALGVIMYELLTGRPPFRGDSFLAVLKKQMYDEPVPPRVAVPEQEIPEGFEKIVLQALAKTPADRFADLRALDEALLATRAKEGELRRVTQILALDPTDWDEEGSRNATEKIRPPSAPARAAAEPIPLATFAADLKEKNPELAAKVFDPPKKSDPRPTPGPLPPPTVQLTHLAAPVTAPPVVVQPQAPIVVQMANNSSNFRTIMGVIIGVCIFAFLALWLTDNRGTSKSRPETVDVKKTHPPKTKKKTPTPVAETPDPPSRPSKKVEPPAKQIEPPVEPPTKQVEPPVEPPTKQVEPPVEPPTKQVEPPVEPPTKQVEPPTKQVEPPTKQVEPPTKQVEPPTKKPPPDEGRPERIQPNTFKSKLTALDGRAKSSCGTKSGMKDPRGIRVIVKVTASPKGAAKVSATGAWANTPLGTCIEQILTPMLHFNATQLGGTYKHAISF